MYLFLYISDLVGKNQILFKLKLKARLQIKKISLFVQVFLKNI